jgi:hypothetical protein
MSGLTSGTRVTLPDDQDIPTKRKKLRGIDLISLLVRVDFFEPELSPSFGDLEEFTVVSMPEAAVHKNHGAILRED